MTTRSRSRKLRALSQLNPGCSSAAACLQAAGASRISIARARALEKSILESSFFFSCVGRRSRFQCSALHKLRRMASAGFCPQRPFQRQPGMSTRQKLARITSPASQSASSTAAASRYPSFGSRPRPATPKRMASLQLGSLRARSSTGTQPSGRLG